ncbi:hypothetical protein JCM3263A_15150 [Thermobifida fusca]|jgi:hypothetical protein|uniref:daptide-type RiPP n=1 Tax=Thermobifida fusca TaxID=2021 RepID=UPI000B254578|nr:daptide-type RiPP [Thermobifida fusca]MDD6792413.1 hypothetical protein [Thermobifida fusca]
MKNSVEQLVEPSEVALELEMQELEAMEAPGFWTGAALSAVISASFATTLT